MQQSVNYLMRYEKELAQLSSDDSHAAALVAELAELRSKLELMTARSGDIVLYDNLVELIIRVSDYMLEANEILRRRVRGAMGGEVLELWHDRYDRARREADEAKRDAEEVKRELDEARREADEAKRELDEVKREADETSEKAAERLAASLRASGVDEATIQQALSAFRSDGGER